VLYFVHRKNPERNALVLPKLGCEVWRVST
jgi:hypothetical protein